jgi:hypothetical protein
LEARDAERLHEALAGLEQPGAHGLPGPLPEALAGELRAAEQLTRAAAALADGPRPSFVLGLEEQLRMDLRLGRAAPGTVHRRWLRPGLVVGALALLGLLGLAGLSGEARPGEPLWPVRQVTYRLQAALALSDEARATVALEQAWSLLDTLRRTAGADRLTVAMADGLCDPLVAAYRDAVRSAAGSERLGRRAAVEASDAADALARLSIELPPPLQPPLVEAEAALRAEIRRPGRVVIGQLPTSTPRPPATPLPPTAAATATAILPAATQTPEPPTAMPPSPTVTVRPTASPAPSAEPPATLDPPPARPTRVQTEAPPVPSATPPPSATTVAQHPTNTPDAWPTVPATPEPGPTAVPPRGG